MTLEHELSREVGGRTRPDVVDVFLTEPDEGNGAFSIEESSFPIEES